MSHVQLNFFHDHLVYVVSEIVSLSSPEKQVVSLKDILISPALRSEVNTVHAVGMKMMK